MDKARTCQPLVKVHLGKPEFRRRPVYELALTPEIGWEQALRKCSDVQARLEGNFGSKELTSTLRKDFERQQRLPGVLSKLPGKGSHASLPGSQRPDPGQPFTSLGLFSAILKYAL